MTPYYKQNGITIYHADCRDILPRLGRVNLVLTDPPFSERTHLGARTNRWDARGRAFLDFDSMSLEEIELVFELCVHRLCGWLVTFLDWRYVSRLEQQPPLGLRFIRMGLWNKPDGAPQLSGDRPGMGWEAIAILHSDNRRLKWNGGGHRAVWTCLREKRAIHPAQKPLVLVKGLASLFSDPADIILDPFMGAGTMLRAAKDIGCKAIGCEREERYCEVAANRLRQEVLF